MDQNRLSLLAHATHHFLSPVFPETLDRVLAFAELKPGARVIDLGCGTAAMAAHVAERFGARVDAVDRSPLMIAEAQKRLDARMGVGFDSPGGVTLHCTSSVDYLAASEPADFVIAIGAVALTAGEQEAQVVLAGLAKSVRPGGCLLWGESNWRREPSQMMRMILGPTGAVYGSHAEYIRAGEAAGLHPLYATTSTEQEWDEYAWRYAWALDQHLRAYPEDPDAAIIANRAQGWRALYVQEGREAMGFGLYLFRRPA
jgi:SAM-dependent methyltransferase